MKKKTKTRLLIGGIILVAIVDAFTSTFGAVPVIGGIISSLSNVVWEIIELGLVLGLFSTLKKR